MALGADDTLKVILTTTEGNAAKRPHQAFLYLREPSTGLEEAFPFSIKESGKAKVEVVSATPRHATPPCVERNMD